MTGRLVSMSFGGVEVLVETVVVPGSEKTSALDRTADRVVDVFDRAREAIVGAAASTVVVMGEMASRAVQPDRVEVEFGLGFSVKGDIIVAGATANASLRVKLVYGNDRDGWGEGDAEGNTTGAEATT